MSLILEGDRYVHLVPIKARNLGLSREQSLLLSAQASEPEKESAKKDGSFSLAILLGSGLEQSYKNSLFFSL